MLQDRFDVRAVFNPVGKLAENCAAEFQADAVDGFRAMINRCDIDAVLILQQYWHGWLPILSACDAGKSIYWAGDIDIDSKRDAEIRKHIEESGVAFMMDFPRRFAPATLRLKELIATRLGQPRLLFCHRRMKDDEATVKSEGGADPQRRELIELVDWARYVVGREPTAVTSMGNTTPEFADYRCLSLRFDAVGTAPMVTAQISCGSYIPGSWHEAVGFRPPSAMQICCQRGVAFLDLPNTLVWFDDAGRHLESLENEIPVGEQSLTQFYRAVTSLVRKLGDLDDVYRAASILAAAQQSEIEGRRIAV
jgi:predicted dehydrogenase